MDRQMGNKTYKLEQYLSPISVWALSFGCAVGWGAFVMPGTTFLPIAGPIGTVIGIGIGTVVMLLIGINYYYLMKRYPDAGGTLAYVSHTFGYDHGFLSAWFLILVYIAIIWANATALALIGRNLLGDFFEFGFHYTVSGYDVYLGEVILSVGTILLFGLVCRFRKRIAALVQTFFALVLVGGILFSFAMILGKGNLSMAGLSPAFSQDGSTPVLQIVGIVALTPWAFVGFESVSHSTEEFRFSVKKVLMLLILALFTGMVSYSFLSIIAVSAQPDGFASWMEYIKNLDRLSGLETFPVFYAASSLMGKYGLAVLGITVFAAVITGLVGNFIAASRLLYAMAEDGILPEWFGRLDGDKNPGNAILFLMAVSAFVPFLGRTAIGWIVDVNTIGAVIAYGYTSVAAFYEARKDGDVKIEITGAVGLLVSVAFFLYFMIPNFWKVNALATESYLILAAWSILGFLFFRFVFRKDTQKRFGKSTVVWMVLLFLIFFTSLMWVRQATHGVTDRVLANIGNYYEEKFSNEYEQDVRETEAFFDSQMEIVNDSLTRNSTIQMGLVVLALSIMFSVYTTMAKREKNMEVEKAKAEENSRAKSIFLSNISHDIRTPMNAILGYTNMAKREENDLEQVREYLNKIEASGQHLLALINDVLEMSRIESGKMDLEPVAMDLKKAIVEVRDMFALQMKEKNVEFSVNVSQVRNSRVYCDKNRLNRVLLNLLSNAYKFTPSGGTVSVSLWQIEEDMEGYGSYELRMKDSGIGMSPDFAARVFDAFERERNSTVSGIQGTGLGMAITKSIIDLMGGSIEVDSAPNMGTEFIIHLKLKLQEGWEETDEPQEEEEKTEETIDFGAIHVLLVEDNDINREIAVFILQEAGFKLDTAVNGKEAVDKIAASSQGEYDLVLMDIQMPVMDGYEASRKIRALEDPKLSRIPIIAMTANAFSEDIKAAEEAGMNAHIAKPLNVELMMETIRGVLKARG